MTNDEHGIQNSAMSKQLLQLSLIVNPDSTGSAFGNVVAQVQVGTSDDLTLSAYRAVVLTLTGPETTAVTNFYNNQIAKAKAALSIP